VCIEQGMNSEAIKYIAKITDLQTRAEVGSQKRIPFFVLLFQFYEADPEDFSSILQYAVCLLL
jgi:hypothetical protein